MLFVLRCCVVVVVGGGGGTANSVIVRRLWCITDQGIQAAPGPQRDAGACLNAASAQTQQDLEEIASLKWRLKVGHWWLILERLTILLNPETACSMGIGITP